MNTQREFALRPSFERCAHRGSFITMAYVPAGVFCDDCQTLLSQFIPQPPEVLGYLSADWAWHHRDGKPWTTKEAA